MLVATGYELNELVPPMTGRGMSCNPASHSQSHSLSGKHRSTLGVKNGSALRVEDACNVVFINQLGSIFVIQRDRILVNERTRGRRRPNARPPEPLKSDSASDFSHGMLGALDPLQVIRLGRATRQRDARHVTADLIPR